MRQLFYLSEDMSRIVGGQTIPRNNMSRASNLIHSHICTAAQMQPTKLPESAVAITQSHERSRGLRDSAKTRSGHPPDQNFALQRPLT